MKNRAKTIACCTLAMVTTLCVAVFSSMEQVNFYSGTPSNMRNLFDPTCVAFDTDAPQTGTVNPIIIAPPIPWPNPITDPPPMLVCIASPSRGAGAVPISD